MSATKLSKLTKDNSLHYFLLFTSLFFFSAATNAQKNLIGIYGSGEWGRGLGLRNISGLTYERKFTEHFGVETGALFHNLRAYSDITYKNNPARINHFYLNIPVLFKYYSNIMNVAAGPTFNTRLAKFRSGDLYRQVTEYPIKYPDNFGVGYQLKVSKSLNIKDRFILEPEVSVGNRFEFKKPSLGIGASFKYKF